MKKFYSFIISIFLLFNTCSLVAIAEQTYTPVAEYTYNDSAVMAVPEVYHLEKTGENDFYFIK